MPRSRIVSRRELRPASARVSDPLMGWTGSADTKAQVTLTFDSKDEAIAYVEGAAARFDEILAEVGIFELGDRPPGELSVADARRLEFAKALALRPRLLMLDEVMAGLRPAEIEPSLALINTLKAGGMTIIVVEHVMKAILAVSDQVMVLNQGTLLMTGSPREVLSDPRVIEAYLGQKYAQRQAGGEAGA